MEVPRRNARNRRFRPGDRVRLNVETMGGNKGPGTVVDHLGTTVFVRLDGVEYVLGGWTDCFPRELTLLR